MKTPHLFFGIGAIIHLAGGCVTKPCQSGSAITAAAVSSSSADVHNFHGQMPYGILGKRLGTRLVIDGEFDYETTLPNVLWINAVDRLHRGAALPMEIRGIPLRKGVHYELEGYEAGEFAGVPDWSHSSSKQAFKYGSFFVVTKVIEPKRPSSDGWPATEQTGLAAIHRTDWTDWRKVLESPAAVHDPYYGEYVDLLKHSLVPTEQDAITRAMQAGGDVDMRTTWQASALLRLASGVGSRPDKDFGQAGDFVWEVRVVNASTFGGITGVVWVSTTTGRTRILHP